MDIDQTQQFTFTRLAALTLFASLASGCNDGSDSPTLDEQLSQLITQNQLTGDPSSGRQLPGITDPKAQLGMKLFFSKSLGGNQDVACVSCHHPALGGGDDLALPIGISADQPALLGPGRSREGGNPHPNVPRNAPTTFNIALWDQVLFHDGRVESLGKTPSMNGADGQGIRTPDSSFGQADPLAGANLSAAQARFPVTSKPEMRGHVYAVGESNAELRNRLEARLRNEGASAGEINTDPDGDSINNWVNLFETVYPSTTPATEIITFDRIAEAIATYEQSQVFVNNAWKRYVQGDRQALTESQKSGAILFYRTATEGGAGCVACHSGDFFSDEGFHTLAIPQLGEGKGDGATGTDDFGRMRETGLQKDQYAFRTPSLLNVEHTGPFGHSGAYENLLDVIKHHTAPAEAINTYFSTGECLRLSQLNVGETCENLSEGNAELNTRAALAKLEADQASGQSRLVTVALTDQQLGDLVAFLEALTDPCIEDMDCLGQWIDDANEEVDGNRIRAIDASGNPLIAN